MLERCSRILHTEVVDQFKDEGIDYLVFSEVCKFCCETAMGIGLTQSQKKRSKFMEAIGRTNRRRRNKEY